MKTHTTAQSEMCRVLAVALESCKACGVIKVKYLDDGSRGMGYMTIPLKEKTVFIKVDGAVIEGDLLFVHIGDKMDRRLGLMRDCLIGYSMLNSQESA